MRPERLKQEGGVVESGVVFQAERTVYKEILKWQTVWLVQGSEGGWCAWSPVKDRECGWHEMKLDRWVEARSCRDLEAVVMCLGLF